MTRKLLALILMSALLAACTSTGGIPGLPKPTPTALPQPTDLAPLEPTAAEPEVTETPEENTGDTPTEEVTEDTGEPTEDTENPEETEEIEEEPTEVPELDTIYTDTIADIKLLKQINASNVGHIAISPQSDMLASAEGNDIVLYDMPWPAGATKLTGHAAKINAISWSSDGSHLVSGSDDNTIRIWDTGTGTEALKFDVDSSPVLAVAWSPDGTLIAAGTRKGVVKVYDGTTFEVVQTIQVSPQNVPMGAISWASDSTYFVAALYQGPVNPGDISIWDATTGEAYDGGKLPRNYTAPGPTGVAYSPYEDLIAWPNNNNQGQVSLWEVDGSKNSVEFVGQNKVDSIAWGPDGDIIATGGADHTVHIWDPTDGTDLGQLKGHRDTVTTVCWAADGTFIVSVSADGDIRIWGIPLEF